MALYFLTCYQIIFSFPMDHLSHRISAKMCFIYFIGVNYVQNHIYIIYDWFSLERDPIYVYYYIILGFTRSR